MIETDVLARTPKVLTQEQRQAYFRDGFVVLEGVLSDYWINRLQELTNEFIEMSRNVDSSDARFDLEADHSPQAPRIRRLVSPVDCHEDFWRFPAESELVDVVEDLLGPDIKFHHGKLNFKAPRGGEEVKWHQDIQFWPHTNYSPLTVGVFIEDVVSGQGEVGFIPNSHAGDLYDQYDGDRWVGSINERDLPKIGVDSAVFPVGPAGTLTIHNCRTIHGSMVNSSDMPRPLLLQTYSSADAMTYTNLVRGGGHGEELIRGKKARWARHDPRPCLMPPERLGTIFQAQQREQ